MILSIRTQRSNSVILSFLFQPGSIPQMFVDQGIPTFLFECVTNLRRECESLKNADANTQL
jgi:hypothetical protein